MIYQGSCHCGATRYELEADPVTEVIECNCSHCQRKGLLLSFHPQTQLRIHSGEAKLTQYFFNKHVVQHMFCPVCGCEPFAYGQEPEGYAVAAINVRCLENIDLDELKRQPFDGKSV